MRLWAGWRSARTARAVRVDIIYELPLNPAAGLDRPIITDRDQGLQKGIRRRVHYMDCGQHDASKLLVNSSSTGVSVMQVSLLYLAAGFIAIACSSPALAGEDVGAGHEIYQTQCSPCCIQPGVNGTPPSLTRVASRKAGLLPGFHFTPALQSSGVTWNADTL